MKGSCFLGLFVFSLCDFRTWVTEVNGICFLACSPIARFFLFEIEQYWYVGRGKLIGI